MRVFVISMKSSTERRKRVEQELSAIEFEYFDADNLREDPNHFIFSLYDADKTKRLKGYELTVPELGAFASHMSLWRRCVELDESILIFEDNVNVSDELPQHLDTISQLVEKYGVLKLSNTFESDYKVFETLDENFQVISLLKKSGLGIMAYAITPRVAQRYLDLVPGFFEPVDNFMEHEWRTGQTVYSLTPYLVQRAAIASTIGKRKNKDGASIFSKILPELYRNYVKIRRAIYNKRYK